MADGYNVEVNVEQIMTEIREQIRKESEMDEIPAFDTIPIKVNEAADQQGWSQMLESLTYVNCSYDVPYYWSFGPNSIKTFAKRVVRKLLKCLIPPILAMQNSLNEHIARCLNQLRYSVEQILIQSENHESELKNLSSTITNQKEMLQYALLGQDELKQALQERLADTERQYSERLADTERQYSERLADMEGQYSERLADMEGQYGERLADMERQYSHVVQQLDKANGLLSHLQDEGAFSEVTKDAYHMFCSPSQSGEDGILSFVFRTLGIPEEKCSYLDLGANHAKYLSNTYYFYQKGARGVLVEANPNLIGELKLYRNGDVVLNRCVSDTSGQYVDFYILNGDGLSTPDKAEAEAIVAYNPALKIEQVVSVPTITVNEIMDVYFEGAPVFMNIDIEGEEMKILSAIDFSVHRPLAISIETIPYRTHLVVGMKRQEIVDFMQSKNYVEYAFTGINSIFIDEHRI